MAKYLSYGGLEKVWGLAKNYFPTVKTATVSGTDVSWTTNSGVSAGNVATFAVDANGLVSLQGITTSSLASSHTHDLSIAADSGTSALNMSANTTYKLTAGGSTFIFKTPAHQAHQTLGLIVGSSATATSESGNRGNTTTFINLLGGGTLKDSVQFTGSGSVSVSGANGKVTITGSHQDWGLVAAGSSGTANVTTATSDPYINLVKGATPTFDSGVQLKGSNNVTVSANSGVITISGKANTVTGSSLTADQIILGNGSSTVKASGKTIETSITANSDDKVPTSQAVASYVSTQLGSLTGALVYKGTIASSGGTVTALPASHAVGDVYVVATDGTYAGKACEVGDMVICNKAGTTAVDSDWTVVNGENQVSQSNSEFTTDAASKAFAVVDGTTLNLKVTHHTPSGGSAMSTTAGTAVGWSGAVITGLTSDGKGHITGVTTGTIPANPAKDAALKVASDSGTATQVITMNSNTARTLTVNGDGTWITGAVSGSSNAAVVTLSHATPGDGSDITATQSSTQLTANTSYVVTGVQADGKGHITGVTTAKLPADTHTGKAVYSTAATGKGSGLYVGTSNTATTTSSTGTSSAYIRLHLVNDGTLNSSAANSSVSAVTSGKYYPVELDKNGCLAVSVPWENNTYTVNNGTMQISANSSSAVNTLFTANGATANAINFVNGTGNTVAVTAASGTTPATVTITNDHTKTSVTAVSAYPTGTTASANGGTIKVRDIQFNANGHVTASQERTITLSQVDTKNTAGSTAASASTTYYIIGAASQAANPQTYSSSSVYFKDGVLYSNGTQVMVSGDMEAITDAEINTVCVI